MMTNNNHRKLTKGFLPVLLLSAAMSLPAMSVAAPAPNGKAHAAKEHKDNRNQVRKELQQNQRQAAKQQAEIRRDAQKRQAEVRRDTQKRQAELQKQAAKQRQAEAKAAKTLRQSQARRLELQRQAEIQRQAQFQRQQQLRRQAEFQRQVELRRQAQLQRQFRQNINRNDRVYRNRVYRDDSYYRNRFGSYGYRSNGAQEHLDGFVVDDRGECVLFREHSTGQIFALAGNIGDMREGDHIRYVGVHTYDEYCGTGYPTMEVREIKTVWDSDRHSHAIFDANRDGYYGNWADRYYRY